MTRSQPLVAGCASQWATGFSSRFRRPWRRSAPPSRSSVRCTNTTLADPQRAVEARIGIHTGQVAEHDDDLQGQAVHAAARVLAEAIGGQILTSDEVRKHAEPEVDCSFIDSGLFWLRGFPERWRLYEVSWSDTPAGARPSAISTRLTPFVERDAERASLRRLVEGALAGHGGLGLIAGEPGVGKSRLVGEIADEAEAHGMRVLTGHCVEMSGAPPYLPYVEMIEQAISNPRSPLALREALGDVAPEIARIAPALRRVFPDIPPPVELPAELARRYVWNSFSEFVGRAAQGQPLLVVLEDLHWADESSLLLTEYLAPLLPEMPVLLLGTYRDGEVDLSHPLTRVIGQLERRRLLERVSLRRLSFDGVRAMLRALAGQPAPEELTQLISRETDGNPFFVEELYLHLVESGVLLDEHDRLRRDLRLDEVSVPESIRLVLGQRLDRLASSTREVLVAAAVSGRMFASEIVGDVANASEDALVDAFEEAERARLITSGKTAAEFMFSHELIRQTVLSGVSAVRRERLHLRTAEAISRRYSDDLAAHAGDLAYHLSRAGRYGDRASLVRYLRIAGDRAFDAAAFDDAVGHFEHALSLIPSADQLGRAQAAGTTGDGTAQRWPLGRCAAHHGRRPGPLRDARAGRGHRSFGLGHGLPAGVDRATGRRSTGRATHVGGTRQHRERGQGASAVCAGLGAQSQRRLPGGNGDVRPGSCAC